MKRQSLLAVILLTVGACAGSGADTAVPGAAADTAPFGTAGTAGAAGTSPTVAEPTAAPPTTAPPTTAPPTTAPPTTTAPPPPSTAPPPPSTQAPVPTPAPPPELQLAPCVGSEINLFTTGRRGEIALYQQTLTDLGYDPGEIDGFFGENTYNAARQEIQENGNIDGPSGVFEEWFPDDGAILPAAFQRLGIGCIDSFSGDT